jgi:hypothetical protein
MLLFLSVSFLGVTAIESKEIRDKDIDHLWDSFVKPVFRGEAHIPVVDVSHGNHRFSISDGTNRSAYHYQSNMMLFAEYAYRLKDKEKQEDVLYGLEILKNYVYELHSLREKERKKEVELSGFFRNKNRSGKTNRNVIAFKKINEDGTIDPNHFIWNNISEKQIAGYISYVLMLLSEKDNLCEFEKKLFNYWIDFLIYDYLIPHANGQIYGWHWAGAFPSVTERLHAKLRNPLPKKLAEKPSYSAILDSEWWLFATAAAVNHAIYNKDFVSRYPESHFEVIQKFLNLGYLSFKQRLSGKDPFAYDCGKWKDRDSHRYSGYTKNSFPRDMPAQIDPEATWDIAHFQRMPWILLMLEKGDREHSGYYQGLRERLAQQFVQKILYYNDKGYPLLTTYINGVNGWYKVDQDARTGFGPGSRTYSFVNGGWATLIPFELAIYDAYEKLLKAIVSDAGYETEYRIRCYGTIKYSALKGEGALHGISDRCGKGSLAEARLKMIEYFHLSSQN